MATVNGVPYPAGQTGILNEFRAFAAMPLGAAGVVTNSGVPSFPEGISLVARNSAGNYTFTLVNSLAHLCQVNMTKQIAAAVAAKGITWRITGTTVVSGRITAVTVEWIQVSGAAADVEDNATLFVEIIGST